MREPATVGWIVSGLLICSGSVFADGKSVPVPDRAPLAASSPAPRVISNHIIGYSDFPPASCGYRVAFWMEEAPAARATAPTSAPTNSARVTPESARPAN